MSIIDQKFWFNGLPLPGLSPGGLKFWYGGLPVQGIAGTQTLAPSLYSDADTFYAPEVDQSASGDSVVPGLVADDDAFHAPALATSNTLAPSVHDDSDSFYSPTVVPAATITPGHVASDDAFYTPDVQLGDVGAESPLFNDTDTFYAPLARSFYTLLAVIVTSDDEFLTPVVITARSIFPDDVVIDPDDILTPSVAGQIVIEPPFLVSDVQIYTPVDASTYFIFSELYEDADAFFAPVITTGPVDVLPQLYADGDILYTATVQRQSTQGGGGGGNGNIPKNVKYAMSFTMDDSGLIVALQIQSSQVKNANTRMMLYADSAGLPGALVAQSAVNTSIAIGVNSYTLTVPYSVLIGQTIWAAFHTDTNVSVLGSSTLGARYNTDLFSDGASDPFGASSLDNKKAPIILVILGAVNANMLPSSYFDADTFFVPGVSTSASLLPPYLVDTDFFYAALARNSDDLLTDIYQSDDAFYEAMISTGSVTIAPPLLFDPDESIIPVIGVGDVNVKFPAPFTSNDVFGDTTVTLEGAELPPELVSDEETFYEPSVVSVYTLAPSLVPDDDETTDPVTASPGEVVVQPSSVTDVDQYWFSDAVRQGGDTVIAPDCVVDDDVLYAPAPQTPRRAHRATLRGVATGGPVLAAVAGNDALLDGSAGAAHVQLEGNDA